MYKQTHYQSIGRFDTGKTFVAIVGFISASTSGIVTAEEVIAVLAAAASFDPA